MRFAVTALITILLLSLFATPAVFAGGPPFFYVSVPTGIISPWGQELVHDAVYFLPGVGGGTPYTRTFADNCGSNYSTSSSWTAIVKDGERYAEICTSAAPSIINGIVWSAIGETRTEFALNVMMNSSVPVDGDMWGARRFQLWTPGGELIADQLLHIGDMYTTTLTVYPTDNIATGSYNWQLSQVPEPSCLLAFCGGLIGLLGVVKRR